MVQNGLKLAQNNTKYKNSQNSPKHSWAYNQIFKYIRIFWMNIFIHKNIRLFFLNQIYSDIHSWSFYHAKYIGIFICLISMVTNISGYSFIQKNYIRPTLPRTLLFQVIQHIVKKMNLVTTGVTTPIWFLRVFFVFFKPRNA